MRKYDSNTADITIDWSRFDEEVQTGVELCRIIEEEGYEAYIVGGCVRDIVEWYNAGANEDPEIHDVDIATNMPIDDLYACKKFRCTSNNGEAHGTIVVLYGGYSYEVTQFRTDGDYSDGRHPDSVKFTKSFKDDTDRRDFTINAMGIDCEGNVIDYHNGVEDLEMRVLRTVGNPNERFSEDSLRIIRAMRFAARFGLDIEDETMEAITAGVHKLSNIARERIGAELMKTAEYGHKPFYDVISLLIKSGANEIIDPEVLIDWKNAKRLIRTCVLDEKAVLMACLFNNIPKENLKKAIDLFRYDNNLLKLLTYIYSNTDVVKNPEIDIVRAVKVITNKDIYHLCAYTLIRDGRVIPETTLEEYRALAKKVLPKSKDITAAVTAAGYSGPEFGRILNKVNTWYYKETLNGKQPSNAEVAEFIDNTL